MERPLTTRSRSAPSSDRPDVGAREVWHRWSRFLIGVLAIMVLAFGVIPAVQRVGPVRDMHQAIERSGIDATALFYTESDVSSEAESSIRNALTYPAGLPPGPAAGRRYQAR